MRLIMELGFSAFSPADDSDAAAETLRKAGFEVHRFPVKLRHHLEHPCDDFIEVVGGGPSGPSPVGEWSAEVGEACERFMEAVSAALGPYGGDFVVWGPVDDDYTPFSDPHWGARWTAEQIFNEEDDSEASGARTH